MPSVWYILVGYVNVLKEASGNIYKHSDMLDRFICHCVFATTGLNLVNLKMQSFKIIMNHQL